MKEVEEKNQFKYCMLESNQFNFVSSRIYLELNPFLLFQKACKEEMIIIQKLGRLNSRTWKIGKKFNKFKFIRL